MSDAAMQFSNRVGAEMFQLLSKRLQEISEEPNFDRYSAALGAALIAVAEVLRDPVEKGAAPEKLVGFASRWLNVLLEQIKQKPPTDT
ncbi:MAG TPA: hypothetical protein VI685_25480 [Candidatus Angelobacter sp.]